MPDNPLYDSADLLEEDISRMEGRAYWAIVLLVVALAVTYVACLFVGQSSMTAKDVIDTLLGGGSWGDHYNVFVLRMPRIACAAIVGAGLSVAGMAMQAMFKNPMASPSILGLSSGASFGASLAIAFGFGAFAGSFSIPIMAFVFCFLTLLMVYGLAVTRYGTPVTLLLLSGVAVGAFFGGMTSFIQYVVDPDILQGVVYWTMGSFNRCHWDSFWIVLIVVGIGVAMICTRLRELNLISLGEDQAQTLGVNVKRTRIILLIGTSLAVGGSVAVSGTIGFVGLIIPHICRAIGGPNHKFMAPLCILAGAVFMMIMDAVSNSISFTGVLPVGILTSLLGAPFFVYIMRKRKNEIWG